MEGLTYEELFDVVRREKLRSELQELPGDFYDRVVEYLRSREKLLSSDNPGLERFRIQFKNVKVLVRELFDKREEKIVMLALNSVRSGLSPSALLPFERVFFDSLSSVVSSNRVVLSDVLSCKFSSSSEFVSSKSESSGSHSISSAGISSSNSSSSSSSNSSSSESSDNQTDDVSSGSSSEPEFVKVKFLSDVPRLVDKDLNTHGPFSSGDVVSLPFDVVRVLLKNGRVEVLED